jgi:hypothetical protein
MASATAQRTGWTRRESFVFRIVFLYFLIQALPLDPKYYRHLFRIRWSDFRYRDFFYISRYTPQFIAPAHAPQGWGLNSLTDWGIALIIALAGALIWSFYGQKQRHYDRLYYLLRVLLRYRLSAGMLAYGFIKLFPMQQPYPSIGLKSTFYGDLSDWKVASVSYGVAPSFEAFLGGIEILAGLLLLNRRSASIGAAIVIAFTGNVFLSNLAYGGGEAVYCLYLLSLAAVIVYYDAACWYSLLSLGKPTEPNRYRPHLLAGWKEKGRIVLKAGFLFFSVALPGYLAHAMYRHDPYAYPHTPGLANGSGLYNVSEFRLNHIEHPYSLTDSLRWQDVAFETWNTLSIRTLRPVQADMSNTEEIFLNDEDRNYESAGSAGRRFFSYRIDSSNQVLHLRNKNRHHAGETWDLRFSRPGENRIILSGVNERGDSVYAVLDRLPKIWLLDESYRIPQKRSVLE